MKARWIDAVRVGGAGAQAVQVLDGAAADGRAGGGDRLCCGVRTGQTDDLMPRSEQFWDDGRADEPGRPGDETRMSYLQSS